MVRVQTDAPWTDVDGGQWSVVELCIGIVCACVPTLRPLVNYIVRGKPDTSFGTWDSISLHQGPQVERYAESAVEVKEVATTEGRSRIRTFENPV